MRREELGFEGHEGRGLTEDSGIKFHNFQNKIINNWLALYFGVIVRGHILGYKNIVLEGQFEGSHCGVTFRGQFQGSDFGVSFRGQF